MKKLLIPLITLALLSCQPVYSAASEVTIQNNRIKVKENGVTKDYGTIRKVDKNYKGDVKVYTNKNYNKPAVTIKRNGSTRTQEFSNSSVRECDRTCQVLSEDDE